MSDSLFTVVDVPLLDEQKLGIDTPKKHATGVFLCLGGSDVIPPHHLATKSNGFYALSTLREGWGGVRT